MVPYRNRLYRLRGILLIIFIGTSLLACSSGGSGNTPPVADAGPDQDVATNSRVPVILDGSDSVDANGDALSYSWSVVARPAGASDSLTGADTVSPSFIADVDGSYTFGLVVNDGTVDSAEDRVTVTATTVNAAPSANAGADQEVYIGAQVTLNGSGSYDSNSDPLTYSWTLGSRPATSSATLSGADTASPTFTPDATGDYVISLVVNDGSLSSAPDSVAVRAYLPVTLADSGQTLCTDVTGNTITCAGTGQDGAYSINPMSFTDNGDGTVTDDVTGLMWQQEDDNIQYNGYEVTGRYHATLNPTSTDVCAGLNLGGYNDWRAPSIKELLRILNYGASSPAIDTTFFLNTNTTTGDIYWSGSVRESNIGAPGFWGVNAINGKDSAYSDSVIAYVRCVRGTASPPATYVDNGDGTVTDNATGLMWQQSDDDVLRTWSDALSYCEALSFAGYSDWRLPNNKALESISLDDRGYPAIDNGYFPGTDATPTAYWSSTSYHIDPTYAWAGYFNTGSINQKAKTIQTYVRCVR